jgi:hypothetical protein
MPTSVKPRKPRLRSGETQHKPGRVWADLATIYQTCLSQLHSATTTAPILKDPTFAAHAVERGRMVELANQIVTALPEYLDVLKTIKVNADAYRQQWDALDVQRKQAWANDDREGAIAVREQQDTIEFATLQVGEQYHQWNTNWNSTVNPLLLELLGLIEATRAKMEKQVNAAE